MRPFLRLFLAVCLFSELALPTALGPPAIWDTSLAAYPASGIPTPPIPFAGTPTDFPQFGFRVTIPDGWLVQTGVDSVTMNLPGTNANIGLAPNPGCFHSSQSEAVSVLQSYLNTFATYAGYQVVEPPRGRLIDGHSAAESVISHFLADGRAYQMLAVILGPELSTVWTFSGLMHNTSELSLRPTLNATLDSFVALGGSSPKEYIDSAQRFRLVVPPEWTYEANASVGGAKLDLWLTSVRNEVTFAVSAEAYQGESGYPAARRVLEATLNGLSSRPAFQILEAPSPIDVDGRAAAQAVVTWQPSTYNVVQVIAILPAPEQRLAWGLIGTMFSWDAPFARSCVNEMMRSFDIPDLPGPPTADLGLRILAGGAVAAVLGAVVLAGFLYGRRTRSRPPPPT